ncbi:MAG: SsrA-binding protein SmpB [Planctomycetota bacterium]
MAKKSKSGKSADANKPAIELVLRNRRVRHDYEVLDCYEAGMALTGTEVKSLRDKEVQWADAHARIDHRGQVWLYGLSIAPYRQASAFNHEATAPRRLLLHRREIDKLAGALKTRGLSLVPRQIHFRRGWAKIEICLVRGRKREDKRQALRERERRRDIDRELARRARAR